MLDGAILRNTVIRGGSFEEASFANADLTGASFLDDNMGGAVNLCGTDFGTANLTGVLFKNAIYDENTKFPTGFAINQPGLANTGMLRMLLIDYANVDNHDDD